MKEGKVGMKANGRFCFIVRAVLIVGMFMLIVLPLAARRDRGDYASASAIKSGLKEPTAGSQ